MAGTLLKSISKDERERAHFRSRRMFQTDMEHNLITAEQRGKERGITIGEKRGEKQREEERKETALAFKSKGVPEDAIVEVMKLTPDEAKALGLLQNKKRVKKTPHS